LCGGNPEAIKKSEKAGLPRKRPRPSRGRDKVALAVKRSLLKKALLISPVSRLRGGGGIRENTTQVPEERGFSY